MTAEEIQQRISQALAFKSLAEWSQFTNPTYIVGPPHARLLPALERVEQGKCKRLMVFMPPRIGKSEAVSVNFPPWYLGRNPDKRIILSSYGASLAYVNSRKARNLLDEHGPSVFGVRVAPDSKAVDEWNIHQRRGGLAAVGVDGPATGKGADLAVIDDPVKDMKEALSEIVRANVKDWYRSVLRTRLHPGASIVLLQTRWHEDDLAGFLLDEMKHGGDKWEVIVMPMVADDGALLWPARYGAEEVAAIRASVGSTVWEALYQQRPTAMEGGMFKRHFWRFWSKGGGLGGNRLRGCTTFPSVTLPQKFDHVIVSVDAAFKGKENSDYVSITVWGSVKADRFLIYRLKRQLTFTETVKALKDTHAMVRAITKRSFKTLVEDKANGSAIIDSLANVLGGVIPVEPEGGKESRAAAIQPTVEGGNVYLPEDDPTIDEFINEFASFPKGKHDDEVDSTSQALRYLDSNTGFRISRGLANL